MQFCAFEDLEISQCGGKPKHSEHPMSALKASSPLTNVACRADSVRAFNPGNPQNFACQGSVCQADQLPWRLLPREESCQVTGKWDRQETCWRDEEILLACFLNFIGMDTNLQSISSSVNSATCSGKREFALLCPPLSGSSLTRRWLKLLIMNFH